MENSIVWAALVAAYGWFISQMPKPPYRSDWGDDGYDDFP